MSRDIDPQKEKVITEKLTDKGARDFHEGMSSMERTHKGGGFTGLYGVLLRFLEATPFMDLVSLLIERIFGIFAGEIDWEALLNAMDALVQFLSDVYDAIAGIFNLDFNAFLELLSYSWIHLLNDMTGGLIRDFYDWLLELTGQEPSPQAFWDRDFEAMSANTTELSLMKTNVIDVNIEMDYFARLLDYVKWVIGGIFGGGDGGGDDDDPPWPPWWPG